MLQNENFFRNFKHNSVFSLRYCSSCVVAKVFLREMKFLQFMIWLLKLSAVFCGPRHVLRIYPVAKINSEKLKEILPKALVTVHCTYETTAVEVLLLMRKLNLPGIRFICFTDSDVLLV